MFGDFCYSVVSHSLYMVSPRSSPCFGSSETFQISLIFLLLFLSYTVCPVMDLRTRISTFLSKHLVVVFSALVFAVYVITGFRQVDSDFTTHTQVLVSPDDVL